MRTREANLKAIKDGLYASEADLKKAFADARITSIDGKIKAVLEIMGISDEDAMQLANLDEPPNSKEELFDVVLDVFNEGRWTAPGFVPEPALACADALKSLARVYSWGAVYNMWCSTRGFKTENTQEVMNQYLRGEAHLQDDLTVHLNALKEFDDSNGEALRYIKRKCDNALYSQRINVGCVFEVTEYKAPEFTVSELKSTLRRIKSGWEFHFKGNKKFPTKSPIPLGHIPMHKAVEFVIEYYKKRYKRTVRLSADVLDALLASDEGTAQEQADWLKQRDVAAFNGL